MKKMPKWEKALLIFAWVALFGGLAWLMMSNQNITGFVFSTQTNIQVIDVEVHQDQEFVITTDDSKDLLNLKSFRVWGTVYGNGLVHVYLANSRGDRLIVFTNAPSAGLSDITGLAANIVQPQEVTTHLLIRPSQSKPAANLPEASAIVEGACIDTCIIPKEFRDDTYKIVFEVTDNTAFKLQRVSYEI